MQRNPAGVPRHFPAGKPRVPGLPGRRRAPALGTVVPNAAGRANRVKRPSPNAAGRIPNAAGRLFRQMGKRPNEMGKRRNRLGKRKNEMGKRRNEMGTPANGMGLPEKPAPATPFRLGNAPFAAGRIPFRLGKASRKAAAAARQPRGCSLDCRAAMSLFPISRRQSGKRFRRPSVLHVVYQFGIFLLCPAPALARKSTGICARAGAGQRVRTPTPIKLIHY